MQIPKDAVLLRIFIGESDCHRRQPLYEAIVLKAREMQRNRVAWADGIWKIEPFAHGKNSSPVHGPPNRN
jgi:PII-like signaling protein